MRAMSNSGHRMFFAPPGNLNKKRISHFAAVAACLQIEWSASDIRLHFFFLFCQRCTFVLRIAMALRKT